MPKLRRDGGMLAPPETLDRLIDAGREGALSDLARLCAVPSVSAKGQALPECADLVTGLMRAAGLDARAIPTPGGPPVVFAEARSPRGDAPTILFYNHYDVQPAEPLDLWTTDPFTLTVRDDKAYARGAADDKGHIVSRLLALTAVRAACGGEYPFHVKFLVEGEEEVGSPHLGVFVERNRQLLAADGCIWEEGGENEQGNPSLYCGMRGIAYFELSVRTIAYDAHSGVGGSLLPNAAWRLVWALATLKDSHERILLPGHYDDALPATVRDLQLLDALPDNEAFIGDQFGIPAGGFLGGRQTTGLEWRRRAVFEPTLTLCGIEAGWQGPGAKTVLPAEARCKMDFRLVPDQDPDAVNRNLRAHLDACGFDDVEIRYLGGQKPARVDPDHPLVRLAAETGAEVYGKPAVIVPMVGGSGPMWWFSGFLGMPIVSPGIEYPGVRVHAPDEHIRLGDFTRGTRHLARLLARIDEAVGPAHTAVKESGE
jgi:acetylornithine deacetylase/succinyl-diaminopimelate desuccinylase-like protein